MTKEEIKKFLNNTKVYVNGKSKEIQEKLFSLGYYWASHYPVKETEINFTNAPFLFIYPDNTIVHTNDMDLFMAFGQREVTAEEILSISTEPTYRPFKNADECWEVMKKHQPFGWLKDKEKLEYYCISIAPDLQNCKWWFDKSTFADGTPFGIKEE